MKNKQIFILGIFLIVILIFGFFMINKITWNVVKEISDKETPDKDWLVDNCDCIERENLKCRDGWELVGEVCINGSSFTNVLASCSKYDCLGEIYEVNK